jgi:DNA-binding SARP family transcriptional activator
MEFSVLGKLEAWRDGERLALGPIKQRSLLALLVIHANQAVPTDQIIDELWAEEPARDRHNALWVQVSKLRSALEPGRIPRSDGTVLTTRCPGYVLQVEPDHVDAYRFELLVEEARAWAPSYPALSSVLLTDGLALWRGRAYEEFAYESFAQAEIGRLDELRVEAVELRLDADLRRGWAEELVAELQSLVDQHPLREHLSAQLMLALYRSDRRADALRTYRQLRRRLAEELGLDPSAALQRLEQQIICGDPALDALTAPPSHPPRLAVRGHELREQIGTSALGLTSRPISPRSAASCP